MKNKTKHTPAPWSATAQKGTPGHCFQSQVFSDDACVAYINPTADEKEATANALLISSAPELLQFIKDHYLFLNLDEQKKALELIKKATGDE